MKQFTGIKTVCIQEAFPARFKGIHLINQPWYISILMTILMPFMKQKLRGRVRRQYFVVAYVVSKNMSYRSICMEQNSPLCTSISQQNIYLKSLEASSPPLIVTLLHCCFKNSVVIKLSHNCHMDATRYPTLFTF